MQLGQPMTRLSSAELAQPSFRSLLRGSTLVFACRVIGAVATFATQVMLARWLGAAELGTYVVAFSWCLLLSAMGELGFGSAAIRFIPAARAEGDMGSLRGFLRSSSAAVAIGSTGFCLLGIVAAVSFDVFQPNTSHAPLIVASLTVPLLAFLHLFASVANGFGWTGSAFIPSNVARPLLAMAAIAALWQSGYRLSPVSALLVQTGAVLLCALALGMLIRSRTAGLAGVVPEYRTALWVQTALPLLVIGLFIQYFPEVTMLLLGAYLPSEEVGVFNAAYRIALLMMFGLSAVDAWFMPAAAGLHSQGDRAGLQRLALKVAKLRLFGALVAVAALAVFGRQALAIFGAEFESGYVVLLLLAVAHLFHAAAGPVTALLSVSGYQRRCLAVFGCALGSTVLLISLLVPSFGIEGAAASVMFVTLGWSVWLHILVRGHLGIRSSPLSPAVSMTR
jgi:O-antigen/teichoic acid export membrane protein